jgi:hypothetical protein
VARAFVLVVLASAACATGRPVTPAPPAPAAVTVAPAAAAPPPVEPAAPVDSVAPPLAEPPPPGVDEAPDPAAVAAALERATLTVHTAHAYTGAWPAELEMERGPSVFLLELDLELASYAYRIDPDKLLLESTRGDIVSQAPLATDAPGGHTTAVFVLAKAMQSKRLVLSYDGKRSKPFKLAK